jgi:hypothetical protein
MDRLAPWLVGFAGAFTIAGAALDWDLFMGSRRATLCVRLLGRNGARVFYGVLGVGLIGIAFVVAAAVPAASK